MSDQSINTATLQAIAQEDTDENDRLIEYSQRVREKFIQAIVGGEGELKIPKDKEEREFLLAALKDMSGTAIGVKRIKSTEKQAQSQEALAIAIAQSTADVLRQRPVLPTGGVREVVEVEVVEVPGLTHIGTQPINTADILNDDSIKITA